MLSMIRSHFSKILAFEVVQNESGVGVVMASGKRSS